MRKFLQLALLILVSAASFAQVTVTGTVVDPNGNPFANGTATGQSVAASGQATYSTSPIATSATGFFTLNLQVAATWVFTICAPPVQLGPTVNPTPKQVCFTSQPITISGSGDISASVVAGVSVPILGPAPSSGSTALTYPNSSNGTVCNGLAKPDPAVGSTTLGRATTTAGGELSSSILGVVVSGCGTTGNASIVAFGQTTVLFDSASVTVGDAVGISTITAGSATDLGSPSPTSGASVIGVIVLGSNGMQPSACTTPPGCAIQLQLGGGGGGGGSPNAVVTNPGTNATNSIQPTASTVQGLTVKAPASAGSTLPILQANDNSGNQVLGVLQNDSVLLGKSGAPPGVGSNTSANTDLNGELTASSNAVTYTFGGTYTVHPICGASDETATAANAGVKVTYTGVVSVTFTTTGASDVISYWCTFRN